MVGYSQKSRRLRRLSRLGQAVLLASGALASKATFSAESAIEELVVLGTRVEARTATEVPVPVDGIRSTLSKPVRCSGDCHRGKS